MKKKEAPAKGADNLKKVYGPGAPNPGFPMGKKDSGGSKTGGPQPFPPYKKSKKGK